MYLRLLLLLFYLVPRFARPMPPLAGSSTSREQQAWAATQLDPVASRDENHHHLDDQGTLRRRPQKSVFIVPHLTAPACPAGQRPDASGRCVRIAEVNQSLQLQFLLQKLNNLYGNGGNGGDGNSGTPDEEYEYDDEDETAVDGNHNGGEKQPFQVALPLMQQSVKNHHEQVSFSTTTASPVPSTTPEMDTETLPPTRQTELQESLQTIIAAPTNGKFGNPFTETTTGGDRLETQLEHLKLPQKNTEDDSTVYNVKFDHSHYTASTSLRPEHIYAHQQQQQEEEEEEEEEQEEEEEEQTDDEDLTESTTVTPEIITSTSTQKPPVTPFWWVPQGWEAERTRERPLLLRFWARMPLVRDPGTAGVYPENVPESVIRTRTSGQRGTGRYPSEQYYREVSAHDLYNVLGAKHWRRFRATDR